MNNHFYLNRRNLIKAACIITLYSGIATPIIYAQQAKVSDPVLIDSTFNLYQSGNILLSGQPTRDDLTTLAGKGVTLIINVRTKSEMEKFADENFDEASYVKGLNIDYLNCGVGGHDGYQPEIIALISDKIGKTGGKVLIHCVSAGRATMVWMAWLVRSGQCSIDEAIRLGKKARYSTPFEDLLGFPVTVKELK